MRFPAISVLANPIGQVTLIAEDGWGATPPVSLAATGIAVGTAIWSRRQCVGISPASAMASVAAGREFTLGEVRGGKIVTAGDVSLPVCHPAPGCRSPAWGGRPGSGALA
jgi:hypothetical protein